MHSPIYSVLQQALTGSIGQFTVSEDNYSLEKKTSHAAKQPYIMLNLTKQIKARCLSADYHSVEHHLSFYSNQREREGYFSAYHYTGIFLSDNNRQDAILIRVYFDRNDQICIPPQAWSYSLGTKTKGKQIQAAFQASDHELFKDQVINHVAAIIIEIRKKQREYLEPLVKQYDQLTNHMTSLSQSQLAEFWDSNIKREFLDVLNQCVIIMEELSLYSENGVKVQAEIKLFKNYQHILNSQKQPVQKVSQEAISELEKLSIEAESSAKNTRPKNLEKTPEKTLDKLAQKQMPQTISFLIGKIDSIVKQTEKNRSQADALVLYVLRLDQEFNKADLIEDDCFRVLGALIEAKKCLFQYCISQIENGEACFAEPYYAYVTEIPSGILEQCIARDHDDMLRSLMQHNKASVNTVVKDRLTVSSMVVKYESSACLQLLINKDISLLEIYSQLFTQQFMHGNTQTDDLLGLLKKILILNQQMFKQLSYEKCLRMQKNNLDFLTQLAEDVEKTKGKMLIMRKGKSVNHDNLVLVVKSALEFSKTINFVLTLIGKDKFNIMLVNVLKKDMKGVAEFQALTQGQLTNFLHMDIISEIYTWLAAVNIQLEELSKEAIGKLEQLIENFYQRYLRASGTQNSIFSVLSGLFDLWDKLQAIVTFPEQYPTVFAPLVELNRLEGGLSGIFKLMGQGTPLNTLTSASSSVFNSASKQPSKLATDQPSKQYTEQSRVDSIKRPVDCIGWCEPPPGSYQDERGNTIAP